VTIFWIDEKQEESKKSCQDSRKAKRNRGKRGKWKTVPNPSLTSQVQKRKLNSRLQCKPDGLGNRLEIKAV
jgi:hypothetical protein